MNDKVKRALAAYNGSKSQNITNNKKVSKALELYEKRRKYTAEDELKSLSEKLAKEQEQYNSYISGTHSHGYGETAAKDVLESQRQSRINISKLKNSIEAYRDILGESKADELVSGLDSMDSGYQSVVDWANQFSKFKTEAEYNDAVKVGELYDLPSAEVEKQMGFSKETYETDLAPLKAEYDKLNKDIQFYGRGDKSRFASAKDYNDAKKRRDELAKKMADLKGKNGVAYTTSSGQNITWQSLYDSKKYEEEFNALHGELSSAEDWKKGIEASRKLENPTAREAGGIAAKGVKNRLTYAKKNKYEIEIARANGSDVGDFHLYLEMNSAEEEIYNYYLYKEGEGRAEEFFESIKDSLKKRSENKELEAFARITENTYVIPEVMSVATSVFSGAEYIADAVKGDIGDTNHMANISSTIRGTRMEQIDWEVGGWDAFDFLYGTGMSLADSTVAMATFGGLGGVALGLSAAAQGTNDAINRGMSKGQAFTSGLASGIFEGIFETWSIGAFSDLTKNLKRANFRDIAKYIGKNMWNNAKEETLTEIANIAYDYLANGDFSQYETTIRQYMASGMSESDAKTKVAIELGGQVAEAGASGALMGFGFGVGGGVKARSNIAQSGRAIKDAGQTRNLVDFGKSLGEGTESYDLANKITDKSKAFAIGQLLGIASEDIQSANKGDIVKSLERKGYDTEKANNIADLMLDPDNTMFKNSRGISAYGKTYNDIINNPNSTVSQRNEVYEGILRGVAENRINKANGKKAQADSKPENKTQGILPLSPNYVENRIEQLVASGIPIEQATQVAQREFAENQGKMSTQIEKAVESKFESNPEGKDVNTANGKIITSKKLVASNKDNMAFAVTYDDDTTENVDAKNISFGNEGEALVYSAVMDMNVPVGVAETLIKGYKGNDVKSAGTYVNGVREAFVFGKYNQEADLNNGAYASQLTEEQRNNAFKLGKIYANEKAIEDTKAIVGEAKPNAMKKREGKLHFEGDKLSLTSVQDVSIENLKVLTMAIGKDIHIFESYVDENGKRVYKDAEGNIKSAPNGFYQQLDGSIWIDLNAGNSGQGIMMYTVAHELTHFIKQWSPTKFKALADFLVEQYGKEGVSVAELVREQQAKAKKHGRNISYDVAFEEMVADSMEAMLTDGKVIRELAKKDKGLFNKIKSWIDNLLRRLKKEYQNYSPESAEGQMLLEMTKTFTEAQKLFADALADASDNFAIKGSDKAFVENYLKTKDVVYNLRAAESHQDKLAENYTSDASIDLETLQERYAKIIGIWEKLGGELNSKFLNEWNNKVGKDRAFTIFKAQSGYKYNVELSSMCKKGVPLFEAIDTIVKKEVMNELKTKTLGKAEKEILYDILKNHNFEIPCAICYVEQARQREGVIINDFLDGKIEKNAKGKITKYKLGWNDVLNRVEKEMKKNGVDYTFRNVDKSIATDSYAPADIVMDEATQDAFYKALKKVANAEIVRWNREERKSNQKERRQITDLKPQTIKEVFKGTLPSNLKIFKVLFNNPSSRFKISRDLLYSSATTLNLANAHNDLYSLFNSQGGVAGYKTKQAPIVYWGDILGKTWSPSTVRKEGGIRNQSNSDFQMYTLLDQAQMYIDFSAKGYYLQAYTKVLAELKLFGLSRGKINASLIPQVIEYKNADGSINWAKTMENAGLDENGNPIYDDFEGINHTEAFMLIEDAEYSKNICGICIGYSDNHIRKLLDDNRVQQIIGFHDKTDNPEKRYRGAKYAKNYNGLNEAVKVKADGTEETIHIGFNQFVSKAEKMFKFNKKTETFEGTVNHNGKDYTASDIPRLAADLYLEMCAEKDYRPAYNDFSSHKNYYKLLADFGLYDSQGNYAPHQKVQYNMPDKVPYLDKNGNKAYMSTEAYIKAELQKELKVRDSISEALADTSENGIIPQFVERVNALHSEKADTTLLSDRDSEGNTLTQEQIEFFKDSKVRDENGNLLVCYHGTDADFNTFDYNFISQDNKLGFGFYFMAGKELQFSYKNPLKTYLNITNPITDTSKKFSKEALSELCDNLDIKFDYDSADYDLDVYERLSDSYTGKTENFLKAVIDILGVDGIISENRSVAVAFSPNQIKLTTNTNPTSDPDIRYSLREIVGEDGTNYGVGVYLDSQKLDGLSDKERIDKVREHIEKLGGHTFSAFDNDGNEVKIKVAPKTKYLNEKGKWERANRHLTNFVIEKEKQESLILIDEIISAATFKEKEPAKHNHGWLDNKGKNEWDVWTTYIQDKENTIWEAKLKIANTTNGEKVLYDVHPIEKVGPGRTMPEKPTEDKIPQDTKESQDLFSERVTDEETLDFLNEQMASGEVTKVYRAMQAQPVDDSGNVIKAAVMRVVSYSPLMVEAKTFGKNGKVAIYPAKLFSPMAGMVNGKWSKSIDLNEWEKTTFDLANATTVIDEKTGKPKIDNDKKNASYGETAYYYGLVKGGIDDDGKKLTDVPARYNPYIHTSLSALNDQFSSANKRPELVTVECIVPNSELTSGFRAEGAKDRVGAMNWHSGPTSSRLAKVGKARTVILTRYDMPVRVLPDSEVAKAVAEYIGDTENIAIQGSTVTPSLSSELMNLGISVLNEEQWSQYSKDFPAKTFGKKNKNTITDTDTLYSERILMGSLFSGGGTLEAGLVYQMLDKEFAVEYNKQIASTYTDNHGKEHMFVGDIRDFNSKDKQNVFYLHASPVCKNFSAASHSGGETTLDITTAQATARVLEEQMPQVFTVENVKRYIGSEAYNIITNKLDELGYTWDVDVYKASNYGNATKRERMIIRAVKSGELPAKPQKVSNITSWGEATRDLWETDLTPSYLVRSKIEAIKNTPSLKGVRLTKLDRPLMIYDTTKSKTINYAWADELAPTLTTKCGDARIIMPDGRVYAPTPKFMGRIQGLPDDYKYPKSTTRAFTIIGNGIPTQLTKAVMGGVLDSAYEQTHNGDVLYSERDTNQDYAPAFYSQMGKVVEGVKQEKLAANSVVNLLRGKGVKAEEIRWSGIVPFLEGKKSITKQELLNFINGSMLQIGEQESGTTKYFDAQGNIYTEKSFKAKAYAMAEEQGIDRDKVEFMNDDGELYAYVDNAINGEILSAIGHSGARWSQYKLDGGENYRELVFTLPNNSYSNQMMRMHWGEEAEGVLVHARIQDFDVNGKKMLFIEEIQSDYHNEGLQSGYMNSETDAKIEELKAIADEKFFALEDYSTEMTGNAGEWDIIGKTSKGAKLLREYRVAKANYENAMNDYVKKIPDAPFKENYHEFVLKRLLRMAAEQGYDSIGWTPSEIQSDRWSDEFAEAYRIEYDQEMPKFLRKYGRQWGAKVENTSIPKQTVDGRERILKETELENVKRDIESEKRELARHHDSYERARIQMSIDSMKKTVASLEKELSASLNVWSMDITDSMKNSVLYEGQVMYSERDTESVSTRSLLANALESVAENEIEKNKLAQYKEKIALIEAEQKKLHELREKLFTKGIKGDERREIQEEATRTANRINTYDRQLFNLESTTALKNVLTREKELARKRQKQKDAENLKEYKEKVAETTRQLLEKNRQSRERAIEGRNKTEMRHKVKKVVNDLNNLLLKPTKERHIPEEMRVAVAEALAIVNMDTVDADTRVARYNELIAKEKNPDVIDSLTESRDRILNQGTKLGEKLTKLKDAYDKIRKSTDDSVNSMYDDVIYNKIESVQEKVGKTPLRNMTLEQLENVYELYKMVLTFVRDSNKAFAEDLKMTRQALGSNTFAEIKANNKARDRIKFEGIERFGWKNLKPMQAMKTIGSGILQKLWNNVLYGQEVFAQDYDEAVKFAKGMKEKYGYNKWDLNKLYSFESKSGKVMKINLEQMMSIYAYSKRKQADEHIEKGGILLNESIIKEKKHGRTVEVKVNDSTAYRLNKMQVSEIIATLEKKFPGAKDFVDEMQKYLSETMGEKGNEVSMKMYGIKLFKEEHYFPLKSSKDFMESANAKLKGDVKIKNKGMTKSTVEHASNPIVLEGFLDVWANHINEMAMYHGLVLPLEDFSRTLNYGFKADDKLNADAESVRTALRSAFGESADNYLNELLKAINGGVLHDSSTEFADKMISKFKKAKVMASLSVVVQQPTAIIRAMGIIEPKYFVAQNFNHKATWEELKKYCPTAIIKETGSFDTNMGRTIVDMVKEDRKFTEKVGDALGKAPAWMDEMGWNMIWRALKNKVATEQKLSGEELLKECGKQMTLIINETQVYDSVMSRNEMMRSKSAFAKMATAFMGEPSTVANMIYGAVLDFKRGKKGFASKTVAAVISSVVVNGLVSSLVYAFRDDDEEKTWFEKYLASATTEVIDGLNPLTYIPFVKDAYSLFQGYDVERTDLALIGDVYEALNDFYNVLNPEAYEDMSSGEIAKYIYENAKPLLTSICDMFGLPVGNILRDAEAIIVNDNLSMSKTSGVGSGLAIKEGWLNASPDRLDKFFGDEKYHKLYLIANNGDTAYVKNEVAEMVADKIKSGKTEKEAKTSVRTSFTGVYRDEYKKAYKNRDAEEMNRIRKFLYATGLWNSLTELDSLLANWRKED